MAAFGTAFGGGAAANAGHNPNKDVEISSPPEDSISSLSFSPTANLLVATSWDSQVPYVHAVHTVPPSMTAASAGNPGCRDARALCTRSICVRPTIN